MEFMSSRDPDFCTEESFKTYSEILKETNAYMQNYSAQRKLKLLGISKEL